jgi:hypothetical protein
MTIAPVREGPERPGILKGQKNENLLFVPTFQLLCASAMKPRWIDNYAGKFELVEKANA